MAKKNSDMSGGADTEETPVYRSENEPKVKKDRSEFKFKSEAELKLARAMKANHAIERIQGGNEALEAVVLNRYADFSDGEIESAFTMIETQWMETKTRILAARAKKVEKKVTVFH